MLASLREVELMAETMGVERKHGAPIRSVYGKVHGVLFVCRVNLDGCYGNEIMTNQRKSDHGWDGDVCPFCKKESM